MASINLTCKSKGDDGKTHWQKGGLTDYAVLVFIEGKAANGELGTATNGWKLHDVLKAAVEKAAATKDKNIAG
jgi:hypothetical protein